MARLFPPFLIAIIAFVVDVDSRLRCLLLSDLLRHVQRRDQHALWHAVLHGGPYKHVHVKSEDSPLEFALL